MDDNETWEINLSDKRTLNVTGKSYRALEAASEMLGPHTRYVKVATRSMGHGSVPGDEIIVNCDHVVTARKIG